MYNLRRLFNRNRRAIYLGLAIITFLVIIGYLIIKYYTNKDEDLVEKGYTYRVNTDLSEDISLKSTTSATSGKNVASSKLEKDAKAIEDFINYCNEGKTETAYNMLTDECKQELYNSLEDFVVYYYGNIFNEERKSFEIENWANDTYKVDIVPDMLSTGKSNEGEVKQDYITVISQNGERKLNINNYLGRTKINKTENKENVEITVNYKDTYMEYEKYNITVKNNNDNKAVLSNSIDSLDSIYLEDKNGIKYPVYTNEITSEMLEFNPKEERTINLKFYSRFSSTRRIEHIVFAQAILNYSKDEDKIEKVIVNIL